MAAYTADDYAAWIVKNQDKKGSKEFDTVAKAYQEAKTSEAVPTPTPSGGGIPGPRQMSPEDIQSFAQRAAISQARGEHPILSKLADISAGLTSLPRQAINAISPDVANALFPQTGVSPESTAYKAGQLAGDIAVTYPVGGAIAAPVRALAARVPAIAQYAAPVATAIESSGFTAGPGARGIPAWGARALGGGITGGAAAAITAPEETGTGAAVGAGVGLAAPAVVGSLAKGAGLISDVLRGNVAEIKAGKIAREAAGNQIAAIRAALTAAPEDLLAAQATAGIQRNAWQALGALANKSDAASTVLKRQAADDLASLQRMAEGGNATEQRAAYDQAIQRLNQLTSDMRSIELQSANQAGQTINRLAPQLEQRQASYINALREGVPVGETLPGQATLHPGAEAAQQRAMQKEGLPLDKLISSIQTGKDWQQTSDIFADIAKQRRSEANFIEGQIGSLEAHGLRPLDANAISDALDAKMAAPGTRASTNTVKVLQAVKDDLANLTAKGGGIIDAHDLYTLRKEGINERIAQILGQTDPKISAKVTNNALKEIRPLIDDAIEKAGGTGWRDYLKTYSQGMQAIDQKAMAAEAAQLFEKSPQEYVRLVRGNNPDAVEAIFGPGSYDIFKEMASKMPTLEKVAARVERGETIKEAAQKGTEELGQITDKYASTFKIPWGLSAKTAAINKGLDVIERNLGEKVATKLREGMLSGQSALELLNTLPTAERNKVLSVLTNPASWKGAGTVAARAATVQNTPTNSLSPENQNALAR